MRASILVLGPLLARFGKAEVSLPGGCAIGSRPVDIHLKGLEQMGAEILIEKGYVIAKTDGLKGANITLDFPSVGATENLMMAAVWAKGKTVIDNCAKEPEIVDLANFLKQFGTKIEGDGTGQIIIEGRDFNQYQKVENNQYHIIGDRIEAATYIIGALMTDSKLEVKGFDPAHIQAVTDVLIKIGAKLDITASSVIAHSSGRLRGAKVDTAPYPGFPTDVQAQLIALMGVSEGISYVRENIFENRFMHVLELVRMGANIKSEGNRAVVTAVKRLSGAEVMATDLRASVSLVLAGLVADGITTVSRLYHLERGYESLVDKLSGCGADIRIEY
mgnify:CR=1 FL=1